MEFWNRLSQRIEQAPGVVAVGLSTTLPPDNGGDVNNFDLLAHPVAPGTSQPAAPWAFVSNGYFAAMGIPLLEGRLFTPADTTQDSPVVVVSRAWAAHYFPGEPVLGQQLLEGGCTTCVPTTVIGVVGDVHYLGLNTAPEGVYAPLVYAAPRGASMVFRSRGAPEGEFNAIRQQVAALDPELPFQGRTLRDAVSESLSDPRRWTAILSSFASVSLGLAAIGIFGLMSFVVRQRRREIGIRMALGAAPGAVTRMIVVRGIRYALLGAGIGVVLSLIQLRWLRGLLFQVAPSDPMAMAIGAGILVGAGFLACWLPGLRAARIRPLDAIRSD